MCQSSSNSTGMSESLEPAEDSELLLAAAVVSAGGAVAVVNPSGPDVFSLACRLGSSFVVSVGIWGYSSSCDPSDGLGASGSGAGTGSC